MRMSAITTPTIWQLPLMGRMGLRHAGPLGHLGLSELGGVPSVDESFA